MDTWFVNGDVLAFTDEGVENAEALGMQDGRIIFVGSFADARERMSPTAEVLDLEGQTLMPGIHDAHMQGKHLTALTGIVSSCDLGYEGGTIESILGKLKAALLGPGEVADLHSGLVLAATNFFGPATLPLGRTLTRDDLDRLSLSTDEDEFGTGTTRPVVVIDKGAHARYVNTKAIENAGVESMAEPESGRIGRDENGRVTGVFSDFPGAWGPTRPLGDEADVDERLVDLAEANYVGITSMFEAAGTMTSADVWARIADRGQLTVRVNQSINVTA